jgi:threonine/homoserine/homoserine lactone efflux protein
MLPYFFGHIGLVAAIVELLLVPRTETRARFHAAQGLALQIAILMLVGAFGFVALISGNSTGSRLFGAAYTIFLIVSMVRAWKGKPHHIAPLDEATKFFDEKIKPRK